MEDWNRESEAWSTGWSRFGKESGQTGLSFVRGSCNGDAALVQRVGVSLIGVARVILLYSARRASPGCQNSDHSQIYGVFYSPMQGRDDADLHASFNFDGLARAEDGSHDLMKMMGTCCTLLCKS